MLQKAVAWGNGAFARTWLWRVLLTAYAGVVLLTLAPVLVASVGADDSYWILATPPDADGSLWKAFWAPLTHAFDFTGQARTTSLATSERRVVAMLAMNVATMLSVSPAVIWAAIKVGLLALGLGAANLFMIQLSFRTREGHSRGLSASTRAFILISLPLTIALGAKSQNDASLNGWIHYPTLAYGPLVVYLLVAALSLKASTLLQRNFKIWLAPVVIVMGVIALMVNLSYELIALTIPVSVLVLLLQPLPAAESWWARWKSKVVVMFALGGTYTAIFLWVRWRISRMECHVDNTCYPGTVVEFSPRTLWYNFLGALPGRNGEFVVAEAAATGREIPDVSALSLTIGVLGAALLIGLWVSWNARHNLAVRKTGLGTVRAEEGTGEVYGLVVMIGVSIVMALGSAGITGITANAVDQLTTPMLSYRNGVVTWSAISLAIVAGVRLLMLTRWRWVQLGSVVALLAILAGGISMYLPRNIESAQANRIDRHSLSIDSLHREVALGDPSKAGDKRRCQSVIDHRATYSKNLSRFTRTIKSTYKAYAFYHDAPYCSTGEGLD